MKNVMKKKKEKYHVCMSLDVVKIGSKLFLLTSGSDVQIFALKFHPQPTNYSLWENLYVQC